MVVIAITGGFATGKSTLASLIEDAGQKVIYTDSIAKIIISEDDNLKKELIKEFGELTFVDGKFNAEFISSIVFSGEAEAKSRLDRLNQIVHPKVIEEMTRQIEEAGTNGVKHIFVESALIFEAGLEDGFDYIVTVSCTIENQIARGIKRGLPSKDAVLNRINSQISLKEKEKLSDFVVKNDSTLQDLKNTLGFILPVLLSLPPKDINEGDDDDN